MSRRLQDGTAEKATLVAVTFGKRHLKINCAPTSEELLKKFPYAPKALQFVSVTKSYAFVDWLFEANHDEEEQFMWVGLLLAFGCLKVVLSGKDYERDKSEL